MIIQKKCGFKENEAIKDSGKCDKFGMDNP